jgi:surfactin synthase thioesterase subunit
MFPGKHFFLQTDEAAVLQVINEALERILESQEAQ